MNMKDTDKTDFQIFDFSVFSGDRKAKIGAFSRKKGQNLAFRPPENTEKFTGKSFWPPGQPGLFQKGPMMGQNGVRSAKMRLFCHIMIMVHYGPYGRNFLILRKTWTIL